MQHKLPAWMYAVLALPYLGLLYPPLYNLREPTLFGFPFFYWYQLLWVLIGGALIGLVYWVER